MSYRILEGSVYRLSAIAFFPPVLTTVDNEMGRTFKERLAEEGHRLHPLASKTASAGLQFHPRSTVGRLTHACPGKGLVTPGRAKFFLGKFSRRTASLQRVELTAVDIQRRVGQFHIQGSIVGAILGSRHCHPTKEFLYSADHPPVCDVTLH